MMLFVLLAMACRNSIKSSSNTAASGIQKINISRDQVYDLSGYAAAGDGNPYNLFDENSFVDPRNDQRPDAFIPITNCQPRLHAAMYFSKSSGSRIVVDLKIRYALKEIYLYDRSHTADSFWIFTGNLKKWKKVSSMSTVSQPGNWGWKKITLNDESRFVMIQFSSYETTLSEMVLYGTALEAIPQENPIVQQEEFTKTPLGNFLGVNYIMETEPRLLKPFHYSRLYNFALDFDNDSSRGTEGIRYNMLHYGRFDNHRQEYVFDMDTLQHINQGELWFSIRGVNKWMSDLGLTDKDRPLNKPGTDADKPENYSRHAEMMWHMAAFFGYEKVDTTLMSLSNSPRQSGRGSMHIYENGNEEDATWVGNKYCTPLEYYAQSSADWDGDEGRIGKRFGIQHADPNAKLMTSGLIGLDTNRIKTYALLSENLRDDHQFIWKGGIQYHYYSTRKGRGISPEEDSLRWRLSKVAGFTKRFVPGVKCFLGENGYDKSRTSWQSTPHIPGYSVAQSQGIMIIRSINACFFSGFDAYILYWLSDDNAEDDPRVYLTSGIVRNFPEGKSQIYPGWYYINTLVSQLGKYLPDKVIQEKDDVWIYRYRHSEIPDSIAYFIYKPTVNGSQVADYTLNIGNMSGNRIRKIGLSDDSVVSDEFITVTNGKLKITVREKPEIYFGKEISTAR
jgi:hypothetical protein